MAVNTNEEADALKILSNVKVLNSDRPGVAWPIYNLSKDLVVQDDDIIVIVMDDLYPPDHWDTKLKEHLRNETAVLLVNDGIHKLTDENAPLPILTGSAFNRLNRIIFNPVYYHLWSDTEFYNNAKELKLIKDIRQTHKEIVFEHRHFSVGKRGYDKVDVAWHKFAKQDFNMFKLRMKLPVTVRIKSDMKPLI